MKKLICLLLLCTTELQAADTQLPTITVEGTKLSDVSGEEVKSADLADALTRKVPSVSLVRRSGIANDIILRGQKKDNINILIDNAKIYGACPNRMDPPTSHVLTNNIDGIEVTEGPYDVENFGTLSGAVKITTKKPEQGLQGEVSLNAGRWDYNKATTTVSGGTEKVRFLISASSENGDQYEDGDGNDFAQQIENLNPSTMAAMNPRYKSEYADMDAYEKKTFMGKFYIDVADNQELKLSYTNNQSDDVLYPSSKMDALYDDSEIVNVEYSMKNLSEYSKSLDVQYYNSSVEHPMSTYYRISSGTDSANEKISYLSTDMQGLKLINRLDLNNSTELTVGLDTSIRNWDGTYTGFGTSSGITGRKSIDDVDTDNVAVFAEVEKKYTSASVKVGGRYDDSSIKPQGTLGLQSNDYSGFGGFVFGTYKISNSTKYFGGVGLASRVPDARELYFRSAMNTVVGTPTLKKTTNTEVDFGVENTFEKVSVKTKLFYSWLNDYIYYNADSATNNFENIDASIYGLDISGSWSVTDNIYVDFGLAYQRGQKDKALSGQTDTDLAELPPMKLNVALNYDHGANTTAAIEVIAAGSWDNYDSDNGEQLVKSYEVVNLKLQHAVSQDLELTVGIDNVFNKTYAVTNTYKDLTLLSDGSGDDVMLMNEPGRYPYINASYKF